MRAIWVVALALAGCAPWTVIQRAEPNPLEGQQFVAALPLDWSEVMIDGLTEKGWDETNDVDMKREWVVDRQIAGDEYQNGLYGRMGKRIVPGAAPFTIKTSVMSLKTGGFRPLVFVVRSRLLSSDQRVLDEIEIELKETGGKHEWGLFRRRLSHAAHQAGADVGRYFVERSE